MFLCVCAPSVADLQNVKVGGQIVVLGEYYRNVETPGDGLRWPAASLFGRATGTGPHLANDVYSAFGWDSDGHGYAAVSQWTRLNVTADFTDQVSAFIEFDCINEWGTRFRSNYTTGVDMRNAGDVNLYQSYIDVQEMFGAPLALRIGRQELSFGSGWLVGPNDGGPAPAWGLFFDGVRLTYATDVFSVDAWGAKLGENSPVEQDGDVDFYGVYATYSGIENHVFDAYYLLVRDARSIAADTLDTPFSRLDILEKVCDLDSYEPTMLNSVGVRAAGEVCGFDYEAEAAYQWGDADQIGSLFRSYFYGDNHAEFDQWAANLQLGYTFDVAWTPRVYVGYAYFGGEDNRELTLLGLINPFTRPEASVSFNRLFSNWSYSAILDGTDFSNVHVYRIGASALPTECLELTLDVAYLVADEAFDAPYRLKYKDFIIYFDGYSSIFSRENSKDLGLETTLAATYQYSEDLYLCVGWSHLFVGEGLEDGNFNGANGLDFNGGTGDEDADYFFWETGLAF